METIEIKNPTLEGLQQAYNLVAFASLKEHNKPITSESVEIEAARIERCVEFYYKRDKKVEYNLQQFASKFLQDNFKGLIKNKYSGQYLDDVVDEVQEKKFYLDDAKFIF